MEDSIHLPSLGCDVTLAEIYDGIDFAETSSDEGAAPQMGLGYVAGTVNSDVGVHLVTWRGGR